MAAPAPQPKNSRDYRRSRGRSKETLRSRWGGKGQREKIGINDDFQYLEDQELTQNASSDQIFKDNYRKRGIQAGNFNYRAEQNAAANDSDSKETQNEPYVIPRSRGITQVRREERRVSNNSPYPQATESSPNPSVDEVFNASYQNQGIQAQDLASPIKKVVDKTGSDYQTKYQSRENNESKRNFRAKTNFPKINDAKLPREIPKKPKFKANSKVKKALAKSKASAASTSIFVWYGNLWFWVQLPIVIVSIVGLALATGTESNAIGFLDTVSRLGISGDVLAITEFFTGRDLSLAGALEATGLGLFFLCYITTLAIGAIAFMAMYLQYTFSLSNCLSGNRQSLKTNSLLIVFLGYLTPGLNILPWLFVWVIVVWMYPE